MKFLLALPLLLSSSFAFASLGSKVYLSCHQKFIQLEVSADEDGSFFIESTTHDHGPIFSSDEDQFYLMSGVTQEKNVQGPGHVSIDDNKVILTFEDKAKTQLVLTVKKTAGDEASLLFSSSNKDLLKAALKGLDLDPADLSFFDSCTIAP